MKRGLVFLVDDDTDLLAAAADWLDASGFAVRGFADPAEVPAAVADEMPDVLVTDLRMPGIDGLELLSRLKGINPDLPVVVITGHGDVAQAVRAMRDGAEDFLEKPYDADHFVAVLERAIERRRMREELGRLQALVAAPEAGMIGQSLTIEALRDRIAMLSSVSMNVLIVGETGSGKEVAARALHALSGGKAFVVLNCAAIPETLFEIEVFGHAAGAFPGAMARPGRAEAAEGGTLFLDEIESAPPSVQAKLLRLLEDRAVTRLGENVPRPLEMRVIAAAKTDLAQSRADGAFRDDLYYRLAETVVSVPPLRGRGGDVGLLFSHFAALAAARYGRAQPALEAVDLAVLQNRVWPGNVRELKALAERVALGLETLGEGPVADTGSALADRVAAFETREIRAALDRAGGNVAKAALLLDLPRRTLADKMARLGIT